MDFNYSNTSMRQGTKNKVKSFNDSYNIIIII